MKKDFSHQTKRLQYVQVNQTRGARPKMRERKVRGGVKWHGALEQKDVKKKKMGVKQGLGVTGKPRDSSRNKCR
jgi:hypothetical protein